MKKIAYILLGLVFISTASCQEVSEVKVQVVEEDGVTPVRGAEVEVIYLGYSGESTQRKKGLTNTQGFYKTNGTAQLRISVIVEKEGYYLTDIDRLSRKENHNIKCVLRKMRNPIALFAKRLQIVPPVLDEEFGYDCEVGDWVAPHGKGKIGDLLFTSKFIRKIDDYTDYKYEVSFRLSNEFDGFLKFDQKERSKYKSPYVADEKGLTRNSGLYYIYKEPNKALETNAEPRRGYIFRLRTKVDSEGNITSCHYAKAYGDIPDLKIYFNPTPNDRNLEFDPKRNLFKDLDVTEMVREP